jgi:hypothetical protein
MRMSRVVARGRSWLDQTGRLPVMRLQPMRDGAFDKAGRTSASSRGPNALLVSPRAARFRVA